MPSEWRDGGGQCSDDLRDMISQELLQARIADHEQASRDFTNKAIANRAAADALKALLAMAPPQSILDAAKADAEKGAKKKRKKKKAQRSG